MSREQSLRVLARTRMSSGPNRRRPSDDRDVSVVFQGLRGVRHEAGGGTVFVTHFTGETCRNYPYDQAGRGLTECVTLEYQHHFES